ncbi:hypothetical protein ABW19_dt0200638 [Dactylella cylindrospora]|nr:hypothetical protein ABW19_dt0200638 [Dactylella cylindrospora]
MPPKKSTGTRKSKASTAKAAAAAAPAPTSSPPAEVPVPQYTPLQKTIQNTFASAQGTTATHRKLVVTLRATQEKCAQEGLKSEKAFCVEFTRCLNRALVVKKGEAVGDRILRFCDLFIRHIHEKELKDRKAAKTSDGDVEMDVDEDEEEEIPPSCTTRFTRYLLQHLVRGLNAANKAVRFRVCQLFALTLNSIPALDENAFATLKKELVRRMYDKESSIRVQAALALMRLGFGQAEEEEDSDDENDDEGLVQNTVVGRLVDRLSGDNSADVRRAILLNLNHTPLTLPHLLERSRDADSLTRRLVYSRTLPALGDFRLLTISMREKILRWGLEDRDLTVRKAAEKAFVENWVANADSDILEVLERLDVVNSKVAEMAMEAYWNHGNTIEQPFEPEFWDDLSAESAFLARTFNDFCRDPNTPNDHHIDEKMPEVTVLAFIIQKNINLLVTSPPGVPVNAPKQGKKGTQRDAAEVEFVVEQLLLIALKLDYGDEIGRRKMFALLRESLAIVDLPEATVSRIIEVMRKVSGGEREFSSVILEIIAEVHDTIAPEDEPAVDGDDNDSFHSAQSEQSDKPKSRKKKAKKPKKVVDSDDEMMDVDEDDEDDEDDEERAIKEMVTNLRCLFIVQCMLENVEGDLNSNAHLLTMLNGLIVPAVRSQEAPIRERGLRCLGLCCLLEKSLAEENLTLFAHCFNKGHEELQIEAAHIICDILVVHGASIFESEKVQIEQKTLYKMFGKATKLDDNPETQAACVEVLCKLFLAKVVEDEDLLKAMVIAYFSPSTTDNLTLRQTLSYFLPVYCHSRDDNQTRMARIAVATLHTLIGLFGNLDEGEEMVTPSNIASQMADWTDPRKVFRAEGALGPGGKDLTNWDVHVEVAADVIGRIESGSNKEEKKILCQMLGKLVLSPNASAEKLQELAERTGELVEAKAVSDAVSRNALVKFDAAVKKVLAQVEKEKGGNGDRSRSRSRSRPGTRGTDTEGETVVPDETIISEMGDLSIVSPKGVRTKVVKEVETETEGETEAEAEDEDADEDM